MSRLSLRSLTATATFFGVAVGVVQLLNSQKGYRPPVGSPKFDPVTVLLFQIPLLLYRYILPKSVPQKYYKSVSSFMIAVHFAFGLTLAGMLQPSKIQNFPALPMLPNFDPSLAFVAVGSLLPNILAWLTQIRSAEKPLFSSKFQFPLNDEIDWKLVVGSAIFGVGWGWLGICPAPGLVMMGGFGEQWRTISSWILGMSVGRLAIPS
jgi:uncharacterized protein